jgi:hypothetical protein
MVLRKVFGVGLWGVWGLGKGFLGVGEMLREGNLLENNVGFGMGWLGLAGWTCFWWTCFL